MMNKKNADDEKKQSEPQGYYKHSVGEQGRFLYLSNREKEQAKHRRYYAQWYHEVCSWMRPWWRAFTVRLRRYATVVLMVTTIVYTFYAGRQWRTMQGQLEEMRGSSADTKAVAEATKNQAANTEKLALAAAEQSKAAEDAAAAAVQSVEISKQAMVLPNRPWLIPQPFSRPALVAAQPIEMEIILENFGRSPAFDIQPCWDISLDTLPKEPFTPPLCPDAERQKWGQFPAPRITVPGHTIHMLFNIPFLSEETILSLRERRKAVYLYGDVSYKDFAKTEGYTSFCFFITEVEGRTYRPCPSGNIVR